MLDQPVEGPELQTTTKFDGTISAWDSWPETSSDPQLTDSNNP